MHGTVQINLGEIIIRQIVSVALYWGKTPGTQAHTQYFQLLHDHS